jgi:hypothetical protein
LPRFTFSGISAGSSGTLISRKREPSRKNTFTVLPRFQSVAVSANAFESGRQSTSISNRALGPISLFDSATVISALPEALSINSHVLSSASGSPV